MTASEPLNNGRTLASASSHLCLRCRSRGRLAVLGRSPPDGAGDGIAKADADALEEVADEAAAEERVDNDGAAPAPAWPAPAAATPAAAVSPTCEPR